MLRVNQLIAIFWIASSWSMLIGQPESASWQGRVLDAGGKPVSNAGIRLENTQRNWAATTDSSGNFHLPSLAPGSYSVSVLQGQRVARLQAKINIPAGAHLGTLIELTASGGSGVSYRDRDPGDVRNRW